MNNCKKICIICDQNCNYDVIDVLVKCNRISKIYCLFTQVDKIFIPKYRNGCIAISIDMFDKIYKDLDIIIIDPNIKTNINNILEVICENKIKMLDLRDFINYKKTIKQEECLIRYETESVNILLIDGLNTNYTLKFSLDFKEILNEYYVTSYISTKILSSIFDLKYFNPLDYKQLKLNNVEFRNYFSKKFHEKNFNNEISLIDITYPTINYNDFFDEQEIVLIKDYIVAMNPDYVICVLPINRLKLEDQEVIINKIEKDLNINVDSFVAIDYSFDEYTYASKNEVVILESTEQTKNKIHSDIIKNSVNYKPIYCSWIKSDIILLKKEIENKLGKDILYEIV